MNMNEKGRSMWTSWIKGQNRDVALCFFFFLEGGLTVLQKQESVKIPKNLHYLFRLYRIIILILITYTDKIEYWQ